jgi:hypothetical protein
MPGKRTARGAPRAELTAGYIRREIAALQAEATRLHDARLRALGPFTLLECGILGMLGFHLSPSETAPLWVTLSTYLPRSEA